MKEVKEQRSELERCIITEAAEGFKIGVCDDFIERIEKDCLCWRGSREQT